MPLSFTELISYRAFMSGDGRVVRGALAMLYAAWASDTPGRLPPGIEALAQVTALSAEEVQLHYEVLTDGWELRDGRICHGALEAAADRMSQRFGPELEVLRAGWAAAVQPGPVSEEFELVPQEAVKKVRAKGKHMLPKDFTMDPTTFRHVVSVGYDSEDLRKWLLQRFADYSLAKGQMQRDWQAALRNFSASSITLREFRERFGCSLGNKTATDLSARVSPYDRLKEMSRPRAATFNQMTRQNNSDAMADALARGLSSMTEFGDGASAAPGFGSGT